MSKTVPIWSQTEVIRSQTKTFIVFLNAALKLQELMLPQCTVTYRTHRHKLSVCSGWEKVRQEVPLKIFLARRLKKISGKSIQQQPRTTQMWAKIGLKQVENIREELLKSDSRTKLHSNTTTLRVQTSGFPAQEAAPAASKHPLSSVINTHARDQMTKLIIQTQSFHFKWNWFNAMNRPTHWTGSFKARFPVFNYENVL